MAQPGQPAVLVTDFDGTLTRHDFYQLVRDRLVPADTPDHWEAYRRGAMTHFAALQAYFDAARPDPEALIAILDGMNLEPRLTEGLALLEQAGWSVVVVSNGCRWYIDRLLARAGVSLTVHANPGTVVDGRLQMQWPTDTPFPSPQTGISKAAVVQSLLAEGREVAFAGDGPPDVEPALLVPPSRRFARAHLAAALDARVEPYRPFTRWLDIAAALAGKES